MPIIVQGYSENEVKFGLVIGAGSFGTVQRGRLNGVYVAIKSLKVSMGHKEEADKELEVMAKLSHRNVLKLIGVIKENFDIHPHLIFEYMENGSLLDFIEKNKIEEKMRLSFAYDIACGMDYLHEMQYIHRDLAGRNVLIDGNKRAKVADFGLSRFIDIDISGYYKIDCEKPLPFRWVPKESIPCEFGGETGKFTFESDVWSFGVTVYEIWSNCQLPYGNVTNDQVVAAICIGKNPNDFDMPEYSPDVRSIVDRIFSVQPSQRPGFAEIKLHLAKIIAREVKPTSPCQSNIENAKISDRMKKLKLPVDSLSLIKPKLPMKNDAPSPTENECPKVVSENHKLLIKQLKEIGCFYTESEIVLKTMSAVDRGLFVKTDPYNWYRPQSIGCNAKITAPHMHAKMLEPLARKIKPGHKCLDIGSGSGYITACLALMVGITGKVYGIDHMEELVKQSRQNIMSDNESLLISKRIQLFVGDGRQGYIDEAPYDIIHIGASVTNLPKAITDQLKEGGRIVTPFGPPEGPQELRVIDKVNGKLVEQRLMPIKLSTMAPLTTKDAQLQAI